MKAVFIAFACLALCAPAFAGQEQAAECRKTLSAEGQALFDAAAPDIKSDSVIRDVLRAKARGLVLGGKMKREVAQANAEAAGQCLLHLKS